MAPKFPRPLRPQPIQVGMFLEQANPLLIPMFIEVYEKPATRQYLPEFSAEDEVFLLKIGVRP